MVGPPVFCYCCRTSCAHPSGFYPLRLETVYSDSIRKAELEARLSYLKVSPVVCPPPPSTHTLHLSLQQHLLRKQPAAADILRPERVRITARLQQLSRISAFSA